MINLERWENNAAKALASTSKNRVGNLAFDVKYKAIDLGLPTVEKAVPKITPAVQTTNNFKNNVVDYSMAAKDTISSIHLKPGRECSVDFDREALSSPNGPARHYPYGQTGRTQRSGATPQPAQSTCEQSRIS